MLLTAKIRLASFEQIQLYDLRVKYAETDLFAGYEIGTMARHVANTDPSKFNHRAQPSIPSSAASCMSLSTSGSRLPALTTVRRL